MDLLFNMGSESSDYLQFVWIEIDKIRIKGIVFLIHSVETRKQFLIFLLWNNNIWKHFPNSFSHPQRNKVLIF
jgi:hypothetical protein